MAGVTAWVRQALQDLGPDAPDVAVRAYIRDKAQSVPESQVSLALRKLRGKVVRAKERGTPPETAST